MSTKISINKNVAFITELSQKFDEIGQKQIIAYLLSKAYKEKRIPPISSYDENEELPTMEQINKWVHEARRFKMDT